MKEIHSIDHHEREKKKTFGYKLLSIPNGIHIFPFKGQIKLFIVLIYHSMSNLVLLSFG